MKMTLPLSFLATVVTLALSGCGDGVPTSEQTMTVTTDASSKAGPIVSKSSSPARSMTPTTNATALATTSPTPKKMYYTVECSTSPEYSPRVTFTDFADAWVSPFDSCEIDRILGAPNLQESQAQKIAGYDKTENIRFLYAICAKTAGHHISGSLSKGQAIELEAALVLCPDHPSAGQMKANIVSAGAAAAEAATIEIDRKSGKFVGSGKYLVGLDLVAGQWQSQGAKVENCYWEISDAQGNIIENNFISVAPQFNIYIPASAAGFTSEGCAFRWIGK